MTKPWIKYKIGKQSSTPNWTNNDYQLLDKVSHVAHLEIAFRILKDAKIRSGLVFDKSQLNTERILVNWLSPNNWAHGSRYGNVEFVFEFEKLYEGLNSYWVEAMTLYTPAACRFLITEKNYDAILTPYNPGTDQGPWVYNSSTNSHYWNGNYCLEFMFEKDVQLDECSKIKFVNHHPNYCNINHSTCQDKGKLKDKIGGKLIAGIIGNDTPLNEKLLTEKGLRGIRPTNDLQLGLDNILRKVYSKKIKFSGKISSSDDFSKTLVKASLNFLFNNKVEEFRECVQIFRSQSDYTKSLEKLVIEKFKIEDKRSLLE